jgi:hypothetical protein
VSRKPIATILSVKLLREARGTNGKPSMLFEVGIGWRDGGSHSLMRFYAQDELGAFMEANKYLSTRYGKDYDGKD